MGLARPGRPVNDDAASVSKRSHDLGLFVVCGQRKPLLGVKIQARSFSLFLAEFASVTLCEIGKGGWNRPLVRRGIEDCVVCVDHGLLGPRPCE